MHEINSYDDIRWACTGGGPFIALEHSLLAEWTGSDAPPAGIVVDTDYRVGKDKTRPACHYDLACSVKQYGKLVYVGDRQGLVLGNDPNHTMWWPRPSGGIMVKWIYAEEEDDLIRFMRIVPELEPVEPVEIWSISDGRIYLFDAVYDGLSALNGDCPDVLSFEIEPGEYTVKNCVYKPNSETMFVLNRLERNG